MSNTTLRSYGNWLYDRVTKGLPTNAPTPVGVETYEQWFLRIRGMPLGGNKRSDISAPAENGKYSSLRSFGNWLADQHAAGLPTDGAPAPGVESYGQWFLRVRGFPLGETAPDSSGATRPKRLPSAPLRADSAHAAVPSPA